MTQGLFSIHAKIGYFQMNFKLIFDHF